MVYDAVAASGTCIKVSNGINGIPRYSNTGVSSAITSAIVEHMFGPFYLTIVVAGLAAAFICPRIPPLSRKADTYYEHTEKKADESLPTNVTSFQWGVVKAVKQAKNNKNYSSVLE
jgi:nucleoside recognition membrane protein YjiH